MPGINPPAQRIIDACESLWDADKTDCSAFVRDVAAALRIRLDGNADAIVAAISAADWQQLPDGVAAAASAAQGNLVIGGLRGPEHTPPRTNGHVVIVVPGPLNRGVYPTAYWGMLGGVGRKSATTNWAWNETDRDRIIYSAKAVG